jgi:UDPglucose--hexose-1-phosphate uridylyltransferase
VAPDRRRRPGSEGAFAEEALAGEPVEAELDDCPFCAGHEDRTPPETLRIGGPPGWLVRVVPNLYPAFERQEVAVHSPRHVRTFADLTDEEVAAVAAAWRGRRQEAAAAGFPYVHALVNEGRSAGSSLPHSHSQLIWLREPPPTVAAERPDALPRLLAEDDLLIAELDGIVAVAHRAGGLPYETLIGGAPFDLATALVLLRTVVRRLRAAEGPVPWNAWLHDGAQPHLELVPRLAIQAGVELGAGIAVNTVAPEDAAAALRDVGV